MAPQKEYSPVPTSRKQVIDYIKLVRAKQPVGSLSDYVEGIPDLSNVDLSDLDLSGGDFSFSIMRKTNLINSHLENTILTGANLMGATIIGTKFNRACMVGCSLQGCDARTTDFTDADLRWSNLLWTNYENNLTISIEKMSGTIAIDGGIITRDTRFKNTAATSTLRIPAVVRLALAQKEEAFSFSALRRYTATLHVLLTDGVKSDLRIEEGEVNCLNELLVQINQHPYFRIFNIKALPTLRGLRQLVTQGIHSDPNSELAITIPREVAEIIGHYVLGDAYTPAQRKHILDYVFNSERCSNKDTFISRIAERRQPQAIDLTASSSSHSHHVSRVLTSKSASPSSGRDTI